MSLAETPDRTARRDARTRAPLVGWALFHLNMMFSSIEEGEPP